MIGTLFNTINVVKEFIKDPKQAANGYKDDLIRAAKGGYKNVTSPGLGAVDGNIVRLVNTLSVEPIIFTTENARRSSAYRSSVNMMLDIFSGYYIQAFKILTEVYGLNAELSISLLNNRNSVISKNNYVADLFSNESFLISKEQKEKNEKTDEDNKYKKEVNTYKIPKSNGVSSTDDMRSWYMQRSLEIAITVGLREVAETTDTKTEKVVNKQTTHTDNYTIIIPITVRAQVWEVSVDDIINFMEPTNSIDKGFMARWREWRSGGISLVDLLFARDLVAEYRKNKIKDSEDIMAVLNKRKVSSLVKKVNHGYQGFEGLYSMILMSDDDMVRFNSFVKGDITKPKFKETLLDAASSMLYCSLNDDYERAGFYITDTQLETVIPFNKLEKNAGKNNNNDMVELVKAILSGRPMTF